MASFNIHLAIGKRYIEKKIIKDEKEFYKGIINPDLVNDKNISHYTGIQDKNDLLRYLQQKVQLNEYLKNKSINSDYQKGVFLHLITDYLFFNNFLNHDYLSNISYPEFRKDLYYSYDIIDDYLEEKYKINCNEILKQTKNNIKKDIIEKNTPNEIRTNILSSDSLDVFIESVSNIDLEEYKNKIIKINKNILP